MITALVDIGYYKKLHSENTRASGVGFRNYSIQRPEKGK